MQKKINFIVSFIGKYKIYFVVGFLVFVGIVYFVFRRDNTNTEAFTVIRTNVEQSVMLSGKVQTSDKADLGFADSGRVNKIYIKNNQQVNQGAVLAQLEIGDLLADLKIKQANLKSANVDIQAAKEELDRVIKQENTKVENAYRKLLSEDLVLMPDSITYNLGAPTITGIYAGTEGQYKVDFDKQRTDLDLRMLTFNLESSEQVINYGGKTPFGTKGLYISFPVNNPSSYANTYWTVDIPNKGGASYLTNYNTYNEAKTNRDLKIQEAEFKYKKLITEGDNGDSIVAQAEIQKINAEIKKNTIHAPFTGKVTNIEKEVGENASVGERVISILGAGGLEVVLKVSELDVSRLGSGVSVKLKLDALPGEEFIGVLETINSRDTQIDGVPVYEAFVKVNSDKRIKTGMTVTGMVNIATKNNVLAIPNYFIKKVGDKNVVEILSDNGKIEEVEVTLGLLGTDSMAEILSGLRQGQKIYAKK